MYFDSFRALLEMDGHGLYVWSAYGISLIVIALLVVAPFRRRRRLLAAIRAGQQREAAAAARRRPQSAVGSLSSEKEPLNAPRA